MRIIVTGGVGFIGTNLIKRLLKYGHKVVSLDNYSTGKKENEQKGCKYFDVDLRLTKDYSFFMDNPDVIFHIAALPRIQPSFEAPSITFNSNVVSTQNICEWARTNGNIPVVYAGSSSIHGDKYANPYTFTKWLGEEVCKMYSNIFKLPVTICRFYNVYGHHQASDGAYCNVLGIFERQYKNGEPLTITGDGEQRRDFTNVEDIVDGLIRVSNRLTLFKGGHIAGEEFEFGNGKNYSINELVEGFGKEYPKEYIPKWEGEVRESLCVDKKAIKELGWKPKGDIIQFIRENYII
jgi:UDP-glucose 4-epimerase|tara:strand:- start:319 stop:1197 length:879 start_codon:yes stop_codon:yes gene_type:complete